MNSTLKTEAEIIKHLNEIPDPEIPVISIVDLGVVRGIKIISELEIDITITPTYSGCPAMKQMEDDIISKLKSLCFEKIKINTIYNPPWTTDWLSDDAKLRLNNYGIAPPQHSSLDKSVLLGKKRNVKCPRCSSTNTELVSQFGSTACKALYKCKECLEPFDYFKCI